MKNYFLALRPKTLIIGTIPVILAYISALQYAKPSVQILLSCLGIALFLQMASNVFNDALDFEKGTDIHRKGPKRQAGRTISLRKLKRLGFVLIGIAILCSFPILSQSPQLIPLGLVCILASYTYTGGPYPLSYHGLGEVAAFVFFGPVAVIGTLLSFGIEIRNSQIVMASIIGIDAAMVMGVNNLRDYATDLKAGKSTLAGKLGQMSFIYLLSLMGGISALLKINFFGADARFLFYLCTLCSAWFFIMLHKDQKQKHVSRLFFFTLFLLLIDFLAMGGFLIANL